jgi:uncharacterized protein (TIGR03435 family)
MRLAVLLTLAATLAAQTFDVASVKRSARALGRDAYPPIVFDAAGVTARNVPLKRLIAEAYNLQPYQISGPAWLEDDEFDVQAKAAGPAAPDQLRTMLQALLTERFHLATHRESKEMRVFEITVAKGGPKLQPGSGTLAQLARRISVQLSIPAMDDPTRPAIAGGSSIPVVDKTGLTGEYDLNVQLKPQPGMDMLALWQHALQDKFGLKLDNRKAKVDLLVVDSATRRLAAE